VVDPELNFGGSMEGEKVQKEHTFATKLAKNSVNQRKTTALVGRGKIPPLPSPLIRHCIINMY